MLPIFQNLNLWKIGESSVFFSGWYSAAKAKENFSSGSYFSLGLQNLFQHNTNIVIERYKTRSNFLTYTCCEFQLMSLNDDVLPDYKLDVPHTPPRVILHYTTFKTTWDWVILFLTLYTTISVPFLVCFAFEHDAVSVLDLLVDWMFLADIALNFHTTYVGKDGEVIDDLKMIRWNYIRSWFFLDLVSSLPYGILTYVTNSSAVSFHFEWLASSFSLRYEFTVKTTTYVIKLHF